MLNGKGLFSHQLKIFPNIIQYADDIAALGTRWVAINTIRKDEPQTESFIARLREHNIFVTAWKYIYLQDPEAEALQAAQFCRKYDIDFFFLDAEGEFKAPWYGGHGNDIKANHFLDVFTGLSGIWDIALCAYRFPTVHNTFPWATCLSKCKYHAPQVYWIQAQNSVAQLERSTNELKNIWEMPIFPIGAAFSEGGWKASKESLLQYCGKMGQYKAWGLWFADEMLSRVKTHFAGSYLADRIAWCEIFKNA